MLPGDRLVEFAGQPVGEFSDFADLVRPVAGSDVELVVERDGELVTLSAPIGWELNSVGASALPGLAPGDRVTSVGDVAVANYTETAAALAAAAAGPVVVTFDRDGFLYTATVAGADRPARRRRPRLPRHRPRDAPGP